MDKSSADRLSKVHPVLSQRVATLIVNLAELGYEFRVVQGLRTYAEQDALYAQGRTKPGSKVTNAKGGQSNHNFGLAADLCVFKNGKPDWNDSVAFKTLGKEAEKLGFEWGGRWKAVDMPHVQLYGLTVPQCRALFEQGGLNAVWSKINQVLKVSPVTQPQPANSLSPKAEDNSASIYVVKAGDTAGRIAKDHGLELIQPKRLNKLNDKFEIRVGDKLKVK